MNDYAELQKAIDAFEELKNMYVMTDEHNPILIKDYVPDALTKYFDKQKMMLNEMQAVDPEVIEAFERALVKQVPFHTYPHEIEDGDLADYLPSKVKKFFKDQRERLGDTNGA